MNLKLYIALLALIVVATSFQMSFAAESADEVEEFFLSDAPVTIDASSLEFKRDKNSYVASGDVVLTQDLNKITAEDVYLDNVKGFARARGTVRVEDKAGNYIEADSIDIQFKEKTATILGARLFYKRENLYFFGDKIEKTGGSTYKFENIGFTTCDCSDEVVPDWSFAVQKGDLTVDGYFKARGAVFRIKKVPIFYSPFIFAPVKTSRQTGLLVPNAGYSTVGGAVFENSLFWAMKENMDMTFYLDLHSKRGTGTGAEYRYIRTPTSYGEMYLYNYRERDIERVRGFREDEYNFYRPLSATSDRWEFDFNHFEQLPYGFIFKADINLVSDDEYLIDFVSASGDRSRESLESNISITKYGKGYIFAAQGRKFDNIFKEDDSDVLQRYPEVTFDIFERPVFGSQLHFSLDTDYVYFERDLDGGGGEGHRGEFKPTLSVPLNLKFFEFTPSYTSHSTFYNTSNASNKRTERHLYEAKGDVVTTLAKSFKPGWLGSKSVVHTIRPRVLYTYRPKVKQSLNPYYDPFDRLDPLNTFTYSLNTALRGKFNDGSIHEFLYFEVLQSYNMREKRGEYNVNPDKPRPFSNIITELTLRPFKKSYIESHGEYSVNKNRTETFDTSFGFKYGFVNNLYTSYRYIRNSVKYIEGGLDVTVTSKVDLHYSVRHSIEDKETIETAGGVRYNSQCWGVDLSYLDRPEDRAVIFTLNLKGLGELVQTKSSINGN